MEVVISAGLFLLITVFGTSIYLSISAVQRANFAGQKVYTESRFLMDMLASEIQSNSIDYQDTYPDTVPEDRLEIRSNGTKKEYWLEDNQLKQRVDGGAPISLSSIAAIEITVLDFYIHPLVPDDTTVPSVTIVWQAEEAGDASEPMTVNLQTTVSLRNY